MLGLGKIKAAMIGGAVVLAAFWAYTSYIERKAATEAVNEIRVDGLEQQNADLKEKLESDDAVNDLQSEDDFINFGCKWLHPNEDNYCGEAN